jgi:hypothetical protein
MKDNKISIEINRPVSEVFEFTINPNNTHLWIDGIVHEEANESPIRLGTEYRNVNKNGEWSEYEVVQFKPNKIFELKQKNSLYNVRYTYEQLSNTKTKLTYFEWVEKGELDGPFTIAVLEKLKSVMEK